MNASLCSLLIAAVLATSVNAHGQMTSPTYRPVTAKFLADSGALKNAGEQELQYAPVENLSQRKQKDFPEAATFDMMNGCRGMVYEAGGPVTALKPGQELPVKWIIQAPHPGYAEFSIVKPKTGAGGKIMYEKAVLLKRIEDFAKSGGEGGDTVTIPTDITGCEKAGDCALQMYWHSDIANQTYPTCADITISGSGAGTGGSSTTTKAPSTGTKAPSKTPTVTTKTPSTGGNTKTPSTGGNTKTPSTGGNTKTPKPTTTAPATTEPPANDADEDCEDELPIAGEEDCDDDLDIADTPAPAAGGNDEYADEYATPAPASGGEVGGEADADEDCEDELPIAGEEDCDDELEIPDTQAPAAATTKAPKATKAPKKTKAPKTPKPSKTKKTKEAVRTSDLGFEELSADDDVAAAVST